MIKNKMNISVDETLKEKGIDRLDRPTLLHALLEVMDSIEFSLEHEKIGQREQTMQHNALYAYAVYKDVYLRENKPLDLPQSKHAPLTPQFWANHQHIEFLFYKLLLDGFYRLNPRGFSQESSRYLDRFSYATETATTST